MSQGSGHSVYGRLQGFTEEVSSRERCNVLVFVLCVCHYF